MFITVVLLLAAVGLLLAAIGSGHIVLAWGSVMLSAAVAARILVRWRRRRDAPEDEPVLLPDEPVDAALGELPPRPASVVTASGDTDAGEEDAEPGEEDTDAADLLIVYELADEVLVVDEHPRYHLARCPWLEHARAERLPVCEARELGFTPCARCRPDTALARKGRAARAATTGSS